MNGLLLIFIGSVLIINGISIIKGYDNKETGIFNGIIGFFCLEPIPIGFYSRQ
ncbi:AmiS/UreI family transporter [Providencia stuartii]|uniref:AmiS/UreI family transporter n=1 Tax=Providencia stuartii TaxID=588 RepID=UPI0034E4E653